MARIRAVKPEVRTDLTVGGWPRDARLAWVYLWNYLDDEGRGRDDLRLLAADLFPLDADVTPKKLDRWLTLMATSPGESGEPPLCRYDVDGQRYLHAVRWTLHQKINRPTQSKLPACPIHGKLNEGSLSHSVNGSVNGSLNGHGGDTDPSSPHAQARVPADQGSGNEGSGNRERGSAAAAAPRGRARRPAADGLPGDVERLKSKLAVRKLEVRWDKLTLAELDEISRLIATHGDERLVSAAIGSYRADDPPVFARAWLAHWRALAPPGELRVVTQRCHIHLLDMPCRSCAADRKGASL